MNIGLSNQDEMYIANLIESGEYKSASSIIGDALRVT